MAKLILKGTRQQTLEDTYNNLQHVKHNWKTGKQDNEKRPLKLKLYNKRIKNNI
jgi:hypothetical protein